MSSSPTQGYPCGQEHDLFEVRPFLSTVPDEVQYLYDTFYLPWAKCKESQASASTEDEKSVPKPMSFTLFAQMVRGWTSVTLPLDSTVKERLLTTTASLSQSHFPPWKGMDFQCLVDMTKDDWSPSWATSPPSRWSPWMYELHPDLLEQCRVGNSKMGLGVRGDLQIPPQIPPVPPCLFTILDSVASAATKSVLTLFPDGTDPKLIRFHHRLGLEFGCVGASMCLWKEWTLHPALLTFYQSIWKVLTQAASLPFAQPNQRASWTSFHECLLDAYVTERCKLTAPLVPHFQWSSIPLSQVEEVTHGGSVIDPPPSKPFGWIDLRKVQTLGLSHLFHLGAETGIRHTHIPTCMRLSPRGLYIMVVGGGEEGGNPPHTPPFAYELWCGYYDSETNQYKFIRAWFDWSHEQGYMAYVPHEQTNESSYGKLYIRSISSHSLSMFLQKMLPSAVSEYFPSRLYLPSLGGI